MKKSNSDKNYISPHDIHQYIIFYALMSVALCVAIVWIWRTRQCRLCRRSAAGHRGEGSRGQTTVTPQPPRPRRRSVSRCQQELAAAPLPPTSTRRHEPYSGMLSASDLNDKMKSVFVYTIMPDAGLVQNIVQSNGTKTCTRAIKILPLL